MNFLKKYFPYLLIVLFVGWFSYYFFIVRSRATYNTIPLAIDWSELDKKKIEKPKEAEETVPISLKAKPSEPGAVKTREVETLTPEEERKFEAFEKMEQKWLTTVKGVIGEKDYPRYLEMRERNEKEKMQAYQEFHDYLRQKKGDQFSYNISEDQSVREKQINERYLAELLKLIGEEKYKKYLSARDQLNEEYRRQNKVFIQVEF